MAFSECYFCWCFNFKLSIHWTYDLNRKAALANKGQISQGTIIPST